MPMPGPPSFSPLGRACVCVCARARARARACACACACASAFVNRGDHRSVGWAERGVSRARLGEERGKKEDDKRHL